MGEPKGGRGGPDMKKWTANAVAVDPIHVFIICPLCGKIHMHGSNGNTTAAEYGSRVPHCGDYSQRSSDEYDIFTTESTLRYREPVTVKKATIYRRYLEALNPRVYRLTRGKKVW